MERLFIQVLLLLATAVTVVVVFHRAKIPSSLGYLLVGVLLGPYTMGPIVDGERLHALAEFGIVFLLFTIGLNFSLPQIYALRHQVLGLGTGQVVLTTAVIGLVAWFAGLSIEAAFVVGAVFAQSSTTIITKQLAEQAEDKTRHGRLGTAMSVFQDVTAVPFVVVIPVLGLATSTEELATSLGWALAKTVLAFVAVVVVGRWVLRPLFHLVASQRSAEVFTLTVLLVSLAAAWTTNSLGLSMAFGAFLAGMILGETEFRHQVESTVRPFRDVLLGLFFISIGMLFDPTSIINVWHWALLGAAVLMGVKMLLVANIVAWAGMDSFTAWRVGILLCVGGEFGFALLALGLSAGVMDADVGQIVLTSVLFSMILAPFIIRHNKFIADLFPKAGVESQAQVMPQADSSQTNFSKHVIICGFGRIGQGVAHFLEEERIPYVALDLDPDRVRVAHLAGDPVFYGDSAEKDLLEAMGVKSARLVVIAHEDIDAAYKAIHHIRQLNSTLPIMVRTRDESHVEILRALGATEVIPETLEAALMIASQALLLLKVPASRVMRRVQDQRNAKYPLLRDYLLEDGFAEDATNKRLHSISLSSSSPVLGKALRELPMKDIVVRQIVRAGELMEDPDSDLILQAGDILVLLGSPAALHHVQDTLLGDLSG